MSRARLQRVARPLAMLTLVATALLGVAVSAQAIPPGGPSADTPGTSSSLQGPTACPTANEPGRLCLNFTVGGFPAGETVYIKIDDGNDPCHEKFGGCVWHQATINGSGTASGQFALPATIAPGSHWLRFLASKELLNADGSFAGVEGYTRKSADFTVAAAATGGAATTGGTTSGSGTTATGGATTTTNAAGDAVATAGTALVVPASADSAADADAGSGEDGAETSEDVRAASAETESGTSWPLVGLGVLAAGIFLATTDLALVLRLRRRG